MNPRTQDDHNGKLTILVGTVFTLFAILALRLFYLQITTFADYARESDQNRIAQKRIKAPRGLIYARDGEVLARNRAFYTIVLERSTRHEYQATVGALRAALGDPKIGGKYSRYHRVIRLKRDVPFRTVAVVEERLKADWPGLAIEIEAQRYYPYGSTAGHLLGYMGILQDKRPAAGAANAYVPGDFIGRTGIEKVYEDSLRGRDGVRFIEVDADGRQRREFPERERPAIPGRDLHLTIDLDVQLAAERALPDTLAGSVVALDPRTGAVLAMASKPGFDPNIFVSFQAQEERKRVLQSETSLLNRTIHGLYPPGSTLKMVASTAALEEGITDTLSTFAACRGSLHVGDTVFHCLQRRGHGELNLLKATEVSCNIYFLHLAQLLGMDTWRTYAARFGFGQPTGIKLEPAESPGLLPTREYYRQRECWTVGHLMNLVIGQGALLVTPIQMARYVAVIANNGYLVTPYVCGTPAPRRPASGISKRTLAIVRESMRRVVYGAHGTGRRVRVPGIQVAGKSGTAQGPHENDDAWFVAFAPLDNPTIAVAVVLEGGGSGGGVAGPVARKVLAAHFAPETLPGAAAPKAQADTSENRPTDSAWALR